eukprot:SAG11_NODE_3979_length_2124_cov_5.405432_1_plen_114_part_00
MTRSSTEEILTSELQQEVVAFPHIFERRVHAVAFPDGFERRVHVVAKSVLSINFVPFNRLVTIPTPIKKEVEKFRTHDGCVGSNRQIFILTQSNINIVHTFSGAYVTHIQHYQ